MLDSKRNYSEHFNSEHLSIGLKSRAVRGAGITVFSQTLVYAVQTISTIILARLLTPNDFGMVAMITVFSMLLVNFGVNGFTEAIIQEKEINHRQMSTLFWVNFAMNTLIALIFVAISPFLAKFYREPRIGLVGVVMAAPIFFTGLSTEHMALLKRNMRFRRIAAIDIGASIISVSIAIVMAIGGWEYWAVVSRQVIVFMLSAVGAWILCRWSPGLPRLGVGVRSMVRFALNTYANFCLTYFNRNVDKLLIGKYFGSEPLGNYDRAYHLSSILPNQLTVPLANVAFATLSRLRDEPERYRYYYGRVISTLALISFPLSAVLTIVGKDLIVLILGSQWEEAGVIFTALGPGIGMTILYSTHGWLHISLGRADRWFRWGIIAFIATVIFYLIGLPFGPLGVAIAYSASSYILIIPALIYAGKPIKLTYRFFWRSMGIYFLPAVAAACICWFVTHCLNAFGEWNILLRIVVPSILCLIIYLAFVVSFHRSVEPLLQFVRLFQEMISVRQPR